MKVAKTIVWYATFLYIQFHRLQQGQLPSASEALSVRSQQSVQYVVAHCKNGRSRSPNVILVFFYLFHFFSFSETEPGTVHGRTFMHFLRSEFQSQVVPVRCVFTACSLVLAPCCELLPCYFSSSFDYCCSINPPFPPVLVVDSLSFLFCLVLFCVFFYNAAARH
jgi:hypothetical protein